MARRRCSAASELASVRKGRKAGAGGALVGVVPEGGEEVVLDHTRVHKVGKLAEHGRGGVVVEYVEVAYAQRRVVVQPLPDVRVLVAYHQADRLPQVQGFLVHSSTSTCYSLFACHNADRLLGSKGPHY